MIYMEQISGAPRRIYNYDLHTNNNYYRSSVKKVSILAINISMHMRTSGKFITLRNGTPKI